MTRSKNPKPKALRRPIVDLPELPSDPWQAPWERREPGPTQRADFVSKGPRRRREPQSPRPVDPEPVTPE